MEGLDCPRKRIGLPLRSGTETGRGVRLPHSVCLLLVACFYLGLGWGGAPSYYSRCFFLSIHKRVYWIENEFLMLVDYKVYISTFVIATTDIDYSYTNSISIPLLFGYEGCSISS